MTLKLFELVGTDETRPFSPFCWRTRMALAHKDLSAESIPWRFTEKGAIAPHGSEKVPVLLHGDNAVVDSWVIANYLEDAYPDRPSLFGGEGGRATDYTEAGVRWQTIIHVVFVFSAVGIAYVDRISNGLIAAANKRSDGHET